MELVQLWCFLWFPIIPVTLLHTVWAGRNHRRSDYVVWWTVYLPVSGTAMHRLLFLKSPPELRRNKSHKIHFCALLLKGLLRSTTSSWKSCGFFQNFGHKAKGVETYLENMKPSSTALKGSCLNHGLQIRLGNVEWTWIIWSCLCNRGQMNCNLP